MTDIDALLEKARKKAVDYGRLRGAKEVADDKLKGIMAELRDDDACMGSVPDQDAWVHRQPEYKQGVKDKENCYADWQTAEIFMRLLLVEAEVWRTKQANDRYMDKAPQ